MRKDDARLNHRLRCSLAAVCGQPARRSRSDALLADAAEKMDRAEIRALLQQRVDVNAPQIDGMTALHWAAYQDDLETAKLLVRRRRQRESREPVWRDAASLACTNGNAAMVELLLEGRRGPEHALCRAAKRPLMTAARDGRPGRR